MVEIAVAGRTRFRMPIGDDAVTVGAGDAATICVRGVDLLAEHILIAPQGPEVWISVARWSAVSATVDGAPFSAGFVPCGASLTVGEVEVRVDRVDGSTGWHGPGAPRWIVAAVAVVALALAASARLAPGCSRGSTGAAAARATSVTAQGGR
jgi:hypothetical protein